MRKEKTTYIFVDFFKHRHPESNLKYDRLRKIFEITDPLDIQFITVVSSSGTNMKTAAETLYVPWTKIPLENCWITADNDSELPENMLLESDGTIVKKNVTLGQLRRFVLNQPILKNNPQYDQ